MLGARPQQQPLLAEDHNLQIEMDFTWAEQKIFHHEANVFQAPLGQRGGGRPRPMFDAQLERPAEVWPAEDDFDPHYTGRARRAAEEEFVRARQPYLDEYDLPEQDLPLPVRNSAPLLPDPEFEEPPRSHAGGVPRRPLKGSLLGDAPPNMHHQEPLRPGREAQYDMPDTEDQLAFSAGPSMRAKLLQVKKQPPTPPEFDPYQARDAPEYLVDDTMSADLPRRRPLLRFPEPRARSSHLLEDPDFQESPGIRPRAAPLLDVPGYLDDIHDAIPRSRGAVLGDRPRGPLLDLPDVYDEALQHLRHRNREAATELEERLHGKIALLLACPKIE